MFEIHEFQHLPLIYSLKWPMNYCYRICTILRMIFKKCQLIEVLCRPSLFTKYAPCKPLFPFQKSFTLSEVLSNYGLYLLFLFVVFSIETRVIYVEDEVLRTVGSFFSFDVWLYKQIDGVPMGSQFRLSSANAFLCFHGQFRRVTRGEMGGRSPLPYFGNWKTCSNFWR